MTLSVYFFVPFCPPCFKPQAYLNRGGIQNIFFRPGCLLTVYVFVCVRTMCTVHIKVHIVWSFFVPTFNLASSDAP